MLQSTPQALRSAASRWVRRFAGTLAASDNVTQGTWVIVAVALGVLMVGLIATPGSPIHDWLSNRVNSIGNIQGNQPTVSLQSATYDPDTYQIMLHGTHFPLVTTLVPAKGGGNDQSDVEIHIIGSAIYDGYTSPSDTNWYGVYVDQWTATTIQLTLAVRPAPGDPIAIEWMPTDTTVTATTLP